MGNFSQNSGSYWTAHTRDKQLIRRNWLSIGDRNQNNVSFLATNNLKHYLILEGFFEQFDFVNMEGCFESIGWYSLEWLGMVKICFRKVQVAVEKQLKPLNEMITDTTKKTLFD